MTDLHEIKAILDRLGLMAVPKEPTEAQRLAALGGPEACRSRGMSLAMASDGAAEVYRRMTSPEAVAEAQRALAEYARRAHGPNHQKDPLSPFGLDAPSPATRAVLTGLRQEAPAIADMDGVLEALARRRIAVPDAAHALLGLLMTPDDAVVTTATEAYRAASGADRVDWDAMQAAIEGAARVLFGFHPWKNNDDGTVAPLPEPDAGRVVGALLMRVASGRLPPADGRTAIVLGGLGHLAGELVEGAMDAYRWYHGGCKLDRNAMEQALKAAAHALHPARRGDTPDAPAP